MSTQPITITESEMRFGPFAQDECFYVEGSKVYEAMKKDGVKMAEFLLLRANDSTSNNNPAIWIVEAKSSAPDPRNSQERFERFIDGIAQKLVNALSLGLACVLGRHPQAKPELPCAFKKLRLDQVQVKFVLVMKDHPGKTLPPLKKALEKALRPTIKTWAFAPTSVTVLNKELAREHGLIETTS